VSAYIARGGENNRRDNKMDLPNTGRIVGNVIPREPFPTAAVYTRRERLIDKNKTRAPIRPPDMRIQLPRGTFSTKPMRSNHVKH
jgi:hypothetical protein